MPIAFSWDLNIGQVLNIVSFLTAGIWAFSSFKAELSSASRRLESVETEVKKLSEVVVSNARLDERVTALGLRITAVEVKNGSHN